MENNRVQICIAVMGDKASGKTKALDLIRDLFEGRGHRIVSFDEDKHILTVENKSCTL